GSRDVEGVDRPAEGQDRPQGQGAVHAAAAGAHRPGAGARACGTAAASGSGRNAGPTTLIGRSPGSSCEVPAVTVGRGVASRFNASALRPPSRDDSVSGSSAASGRSDGSGTAASVAGAAPVR